MNKPVTEMTDRELNEEADAIARRILAGKADGRDAVLVIELSNRLIRATPSQTQRGAA